MNQAGSSIILFSVLVLVLFLAGILTFFCLHLIQSYSQAQKECRDHVLKAQQILGKSLEKLMDLNPQAEKLRNEEKEIKIKLAVAIDPHIIAYYEAKLIENSIQQVRLRSQQHAIISYGELKAQSQLFGVDGATFIPRAKLRVISKPAMAIAPNYYPDRNFEAQQTLKLNWKIHPHFSYLEFITELPQKLLGNCSATLHKGGPSWNPRLNEDKF